MLACDKSLRVNIKYGWGFDSLLDLVITSLEEKVTWPQAIDQGCVIYQLLCLYRWHSQNHCPGKAGPLTPLSFFISESMLSTNHYFLLQRQIFTTNKYASNSVIIRTVIHILLLGTKMLFSTLAKSKHTFTFWLQTLTDFRTELLYSPLNMGRHCDI